ncbi:MAG TPA: oligoribonuclease [Polyangiaceae bacterium]|nr:oligoribonuclease [Polyangiaceae bacterium]
MPSNQRIQRTQSADNLAWIDLEMTGLDAQTDVILQAALVITNAALEPLEEFSCDIFQPAAELAKMGPYVRDMHERTGLLERVQRSRTDLRSAEKQLLERIAGWCPYPALLCGNSIGQDRRFIDQYMPGLAAYLHYRLVDVSTIKVLSRLWYGEAGVYAKPTQGEHDAVFDIRESIAELQFYRRTLFRSQNGVQTQE